MAWGLGLLALTAPIALIVWVFWQLAWLTGFRIEFIARRKRAALRRIRRAYRAALLFAALYVSAPREET